MTIVGTALGVRFWSWRTKLGTNANAIRRLSVDFAIPWIDTFIVAMISGMRRSPSFDPARNLYLGAAAEHYLTGALGGLSGHMRIQSFWPMHAGIATVILVFLVLAGVGLTRLL